MGRKTVLAPHLLAPINLAASAFSEQSTCRDEDSISYLCTWAGNDTVGTLIPQGLILANETNKTSQAAAIWVDIPCDPIAVSGTTDSQIFDLDVRAFIKTRLKCTKASGTAGALAITIMGKVVGA